MTRQLLVQKHQPITKSKYSGNSAYHSVDLMILSIFRLGYRHSLKQSVKYSVLLLGNFSETCFLGVDLSFFETHSNCMCVVRSLTCTGATFTFQTKSADILLQIKPLRIGIKTSTRCSEEVICSADYPVTAEDTYRSRLKP